MSLWLHRPRSCLLYRQAPAGVGLQLGAAGSRGRSTPGGGLQRTSLAASQTTATDTRPRGVQCRAGDNIGGYTPANYITFSSDVRQQCNHRAKVTVDAPVAVCFELMYDWNRLVDFFDLIAQIGLDPAQPHMALLQCFYRWSRLPVMEIVFLLEKSAAQDGKSISFKSQWGMPLEGQVSFEAVAGGKQTAVEVSFSHALPQLLVDMKIGPMAVQGHMAQILAENLAAYKALAETLSSAPKQAAPRKQALGGGGAPPAGTSGWQSMLPQVYPASRRGREVEEQEPYLAASGLVEGGMFRESAGGGGPPAEEEDSDDEMEEEMEEEIEHARSSGSGLPASSSSPSSAGGAGRGSNGSSSGSSNGKVAASPAPLGAATPGRGAAKPPSAPPLRKQRSAAPPVPAPPPATQQQLVPPGRVAGRASPGPPASRPASAAEQGRAGTPRGRVASSNGAQSAPTPALPPSAGSRQQGA